MVDITCFTYRDGKPSDSDLSIVPDNPTLIQSTIRGYMFLDMNSHYYKYECVLTEGTLTVRSGDTRTEITFPPEYGPYVAKQIEEFKVLQRYSRKEYLNRCRARAVERVKEIDDELLGLSTESLSL
jgi:hypothetical protein